jgi:glutamate carboxypeptidase
VIPLPEIARSEAQRVGAAAAARLEEMLGDVRAWVDTDSPGGDVSAVDRMAAIIAHRLEDLGLHPELVPAGDRGLYLHATLEGDGDAHVVLIGHHDTVFPAGTAVARPFSRDAHRCYGPGVADMKGGLVVAAHAAHLLASGPRPFRLLEIVSCPDEESRPAAPATIERLAGADAVLCLECGRPDGEVVSARKGAWWFRVRAEGRPAHAGVEPDTGRNAVHALAHEAVRLAGLHHARTGLTLQVTGLEGGQGLNTVPTAADLAWGRRQAAAFADHSGVRLSIEDLGGPPALERTPHVAALAAAAISLGELVGHRFAEALTGGVSDGSWTAAAGVPTLDGLGPVGGLDHSPDEYVETATFATRCGVVAGLVAAVDAGLLREVDRA